jgi:hypothetical protein
MAARDAELAAGRAEIEAEKAEIIRRQILSLLTDDELRERLETSKVWAAIGNGVNANTLAEMARRGLA